MNFDESVYFFSHGQRDTSAMISNLKWNRTPSFLSQWVVQALEGVKIPIMRDGPLATEFQNGKRMLQPMIFSHGMIVHNLAYTGLCREFASYGFLVIALNHNDGSC
jgi:hypothetical protein